MEYIYYLIFISYLSGSIPYGIIFTKFFGYEDIRKIGSGNIGATNVLRTANKKIAFAVLILDFLKCYLPVLIFSYFYDKNVGALCGLFSIIGHIYPVWLSFKGGKGVACLFGFILALNHVFFIISLFIWLFTIFISKYSSLASIISSITTVFLFFVYDNIVNDVIPLTIVILILLKHGENIKRLIKRKENKVKLL